MRVYNGKYGTMTLKFLVLGIPQVTVMTKFTTQFGLSNSQDMGIIELAGEV